MNEVLELLADVYAWFSGQPAPIQVIVVVGVVAGLYPVVVILRVLIAALYGAFRGLG